MGLIACPDCGRKVSDLAAACPDCARPIRGATATPDTLPEPEPHPLLERLAREQQQSQRRRRILLGLGVPLVIAALAYVLLGRSQQLGLNELAASSLGLLILAAVGLAVLGLYFLPSIIAIAKRHNSEGGIIIVNIFLGWTFLGWVIALAWAASGPSRR